MAATTAKVTSDSAPELFSASANDSPHNFIYAKSEINLTIDLS
jgi:hypothetical protein